MGHPEQLSALKEAVEGGDASLLKTGADEMLRYDTPMPMFERYVLEDLEIGGVRLERGMEVALLYISGNRDSLRFERADQFDLARRDNPLLTFGLGTHYCLGAPLARLEMQVLFGTLLRRLPNVHLAGEAEFARGFVIRGLASLPIGF